MHQRTYNIAHMGASGLYPPNTMAAFRGARAAGAQIIELDVNYSRDDTVIVSHDLTAERFTDGHGAYREMTIEQIKRIDAGVRKGPQFAGERIPTLAEVLDWTLQNPIRLCIEVKGDTFEHYMRAGELTVDLLRRHDHLRWVTLTSFSPECIRAMKAREPRLSWGLDPDEHRPHTPWELCAQALECGANFLLHRHDTLTAEAVDEAHQHGFAVWTWTVDDPTEMRRLISIGADAIMTNRPDVLGTVLEGGRP
jgi:glycerophosphoryl diester phosphodiesterase